MAGSSDDVLEDVERRRAELQANVNKLRSALVHWTTWEAEYDALKEGIQAADNPTPTQMREIARDLQGQLVDEKEVLDLLGKSLQAHRSANQVVDMIARRIDYVQRNESTIEKQLESAEKQLSGYDILLEPGIENEEGLPMMDIEEELDEDGNEISSSINQTGRGTAEVIQALRKSGVIKTDSDVTKKKTAADKTIIPASPALQSKDVKAMSESKSDIAPSLTAGPFSDGTATARLSEASDKPGYTAAETEVAKSLPQAVAQSSKAAVESRKAANPILGGQLDNEGQAAAESGNDTEPIRSDDRKVDAPTEPIIPDGESPEDAELRRQMLEYGLSEVGAVVAELELDDPTASYSDDDYDDDGDDYNTTDDEEEDEYGRNTRPVITDEYRKQMLELEQRLSARMMENVGPQDTNSLSEHVGDIRTMRIRKDDQFDSALQAPPAGAPALDSGKAEKKKGVRFADVVDVSEAPTTRAQSVQATRPAASFAPTISDTIVEHSASPGTSKGGTSKPAKVSKFKSARSGASAPAYTLPNPGVPVTPPVPSGPAGRTLATTITERAPSASDQRPPDEFDPVLIDREIQAHYNKARNKFIGQQGGFKPTEADEESPIVEERDGKTKKVSRFMAARLKADGM